jgi:proteasome assembly chaperone (PAC2) family protein
MKGLQILLQSLGIKIDPAQIESAFAEGKEILPRLAKSFEEMSARQQRIEEKLDRLIDGSLLALTKADKE